ncbi:glycosyltransferase family 2 protein [Celeribacter indicus]|uniref:Succinoglycan biosynthesis protein ExoO n=1 Tax=Celeribacter indicus TaxID=1208324 RepID=A0A0B5E632_9RHOB|nr:glycosyltransferase [Celeribacter indicus]AJE47792.1 succinoglycan biosynthesis protein ExoO [Celeribacter indicus]SDW23051.1 succinoglycan biosynthesis protein ExoO [Celeribacter indicus]
MTLPVSIMIAAYNAQEDLPTAIASARAQTGVAVEIIVVDDASPDDTADLMARDYPDVTYIRLAQNAGPSGARNAAIEAATGGWIAVLDADDGMAPDRLATLLAHAEAAGADAVLGNFRRVDAAGAPLEDGAFLDPGTVDPARPITLEDYVASNLMQEGERSLGYLKPMFRRDFLLEHGIRYDLSLRNSEDFHIVARILEDGGRVVIAPEPDYLYRVAGGSISSVIPPSYVSALLKADAALETRLGERASPRLGALLARRRVALERLRDTETIMHHLKNRRLGPALRDFVRFRNARGLVVQRLREAAAKRMGRPSL